jgi:hypothetical protein
LCQNIRLIRYFIADPLKAFTVLLFIFLTFGLSFVIDYQRNSGCYFCTPGTQKAGNIFPAFPNEMLFLLFYTPALL